MATTPAVAPESQAPINPIGRIVGALFNPKATFEDIARRPSWVAPVILLTVLSGIVSFAINQRIDWREFISHQMEQSPQAANLSPEQKLQRVEGGAKFAPIITYAFGIPAILVITVVVAGVMLGAFNLLGGANLNYSTSLGIVAHAYVPGILSSLLFILVLYLKPFGTVDLDNPVATNVAAFLQGDSPKWLLKLTSSFDLFSCWVIGLMGVGFAAANPKKVTFGKSLGIVISVWAIYVLLRTCWAFIFS